MANGNFGGGDGTKENPYLVEDAWDLDAVRNHRYSCFKQTEDIDLSVIGNFIPICGNGWYYNKAFCGVYDGDNKKVKNLSFTYEISLTGEGRRTYDDIQCVGLFGVAFNCHLKNIKLENVNVNGLDYVGSLVGFLHDVDEVSYIGKEDKGYRHKTIIENCHMLSGTITGGAISEENYSFRPPYNRKPPLPYDSDVAGGLIGYIGHGWNYRYNNEEVIIKKCSAKGTIRGGASRGGFIGRINTNADAIIKISDCFSNVVFENFLVDPIEIVRSQYEIGGFLGVCSLSNRSNISSTLEVKNCYSVDDRSSINQVYNDTTHWGGFASSEYYENEGIVKFESNYYDSLNGLTDALMGEPRTTSQMKKKATFRGWNFGTTWGIEENETYPFFIYGPPRIKCKSFNLKKSLFQ